MDKTEKMLKELTEANGIPGYEGEIREVVKKYINGRGTVSSDRTGSIICAKKGSSESPRIMLAGHMDEIGFMVKFITDDGFIKFTP